MSEIKAGPALDALVAEHVKGWRWQALFTHERDWRDGGVWLEPDDAEHQLIAWGWSTDPGEALRLLEEENRKGRQFSLIYVGNGEYACVEKSNPNYPAWEGDCADAWFHLCAAGCFDSIALAIVVGILEANGVNVRAELANGGGK